VLKKMNRVSVVMVVVTLLVAGAVAGTAFAQKQAVPKPIDRVALGDDQTQQVTVSLTVDVDKNGQITRQEWNRMMTAAFDKLDTNNRGAVDATELTQSQLHVIPSEKFGK